MVEGKEESRIKQREKLAECDSDSRKARANSTDGPSELSQAGAREPDLISYANRSSRVHCRNAVSWVKVALFSRGELRYLCGFSWFWGPEVQNQCVSKAPFPLKVLRLNPSLPLPGFWWL